jgi:hypothetical protein
MPKMASPNKLDKRDIFNPVLNNGAQKQPNKVSNSPKINQDLEQNMFNNMMNNRRLLKTSN